MPREFPVDLKSDTLSKVERLKISPEDFVEDFVLGSGKGGQKINKSSTSVHLKHLPTGLTVSCQKHRERTANRKKAYRLLIDKIEEELDWENSARAKKIEKIKKQKKRRKRRSSSENTS